MNNEEITQLIERLTAITETVVQNQRQLSQQINDLTEKVNSIKNTQQGLPHIVPQRSGIID